MRNTKPLLLGLKFVYLTTLCLSSGCFWVTTKHEGNKLRTDVDDLSKRVGKNEETLGEKVTKLQTTLDEASTFLSQNSANIGAEVSELSQENAKLNGLVMEAKRYTEDIKKQIDDQNMRIAELENKMLSINSQAGASKSADDLFSEGKSALSYKNFAEARKLFNAIVIRYPSHDKADDAQYYQGISFSDEGNHKKALSEFQAVFEKYAKSSLADDALYRAGESAEKLKWCTDARAYYALLRKKYPRSNYASKAKTKDANLKKNKSNSRICKS